MTTAAAAKRYLAQHLAEWAGRGYAIYNPHDKPLDELPVIYGFNNGGAPEWFSGVLLAEDGEYLGGHICSHEFYMPSDLGVKEGSRPDRHEHFRAHYPDGYRMDFVSHADVLAHPGLSDAIRKNGEKREAEEATS
jgi:hypothetical protein